MSFRTLATASSRAGEVSHAGWPRQPHRLTASGREAAMQVRGALYIGGGWVPSTGTETIPVENPATEQVVGSVPEGTPADVDRAVAAARAAFAGWARTGPEERAKLLARLADAVAARRAEFAATITMEMGAPAKLADNVQ